MKPDAGAARAGVCRLFWNIIDKTRFDGRPDESAHETLQGGEMDRQPQAGRRMMIFVVAIFVIACCLAAYFAISIHPGEPEPGGGGGASQNP
ncbi:hypothetical protein [Rhizobium sp. RCC_161_2]|uniref:hypothetical protein n=1 Tax=Rhizobium sp. RCC_161_2 TaxID=3239219 RepID=UPI0035253185